jgi:hypothetical protein
MAEPGYQRNTVKGITSGPHRLEVGRRIATLRVDDPTLDGGRLRECRESGQ